MKKYLGVKMIEAEPMSKFDFKKSSELIPLDKEINQKGYKVVYEDGYESWSPKDIFEKAYKEIKNIIPLGKDNFAIHRKQDYNEAYELEEKTNKLNIFIKSDFYKGIDLDEQMRLKQQLMAMQYYLTILIERIENF